MTRVYLIRHAQAEGNLLGQAQGHTDGAVSDTGLKQIRELEKRFAHIRIDAVYSSDLQRTRATAGAIYLPKNLPLHTDPAFREYCLGIWERRQWDELHKEFPQQMYAFNFDLPRFNIPGAETAQQVLDRFLPAFWRIVEAHDGQTVALVSHGSAMRTAMTILSGGTIGDIGGQDFCDNTAVSCLEVENGVVRIVFRDDNSHLLAAGLSTRPKIRKE